LSPGTPTQEASRCWKQSVFRCWGQGREWPLTHFLVYSLSVTGDGVSSVPVMVISQSRGQKGPVASCQAVFTQCRCRAGQSGFSSQLRQIMEVREKLEVLIINKMPKMAFCYWIAKKASSSQNLKDSERGYNSAIYMEKHKVCLSVNNTIFIKDNQCKTPFVCKMSLALLR
jgi:hypothetical protein